MTNSSPISAPIEDNKTPDTTKQTTFQKITQKSKTPLKFIKKYWWAGIIVILVLLLTILILKPDTIEYEYTTAIVERGDLTQTVEATGSVKPAATIDLRFPTNGQLMENNVVIGQTVKAGDVLAKIDDRELKYQMNQAGANLSQARANLNKIIAGARPEEINISQKSVDQAYTEYTNAQENLKKAETQAINDKQTYYETWQKAIADYNSAIQNSTDTTNYQNQYLINLEDAALTQADIAVAKANVALSQVQTIHDDASAKIYLGSLNPNLKNQESASYDIAKNLVAQATADLTTAKNQLTNTSIVQASSTATAAAYATLENLNYMYQVLANSAYSGSFTYETLEGYKTAIATQITTMGTQTTATESAFQNLASANLNQTTTLNTTQATVIAAENALKIAKANYDSADSTSATKIQNAQNTVNSTQAAWELAKAQLEYKKAPAWNFDVSAYRAQVNQLASAYELAKKRYEDATIKAPIDGIITAVNYEKGELVSNTEPAITMVSSDGFEIKVDISEADIAKLRLENSVDITLDAFGNDLKFTGKIIIIEPAQTVIQEVIYYNVTILFDEATDQTEIKPGMTANVIIHTADRYDVLYIPRRAVVEKDGKKLVKILIDNTTQEVEVETGLRANDGLIEIKEGLHAGETVVTFTKEIK